MVRQTRHGPRSYEQVLADYPTLRQSLLSAWDDCGLSTLFRIQKGDYASHAAARGQLFHRAVAECLRTMKRLGTRQIPAGEALEILYDTMLQRDVPAGERVRVPMREIRELRMAIIKWATDNEFNVDRIVGIERRLEATIVYPSPDGELRERVISGQLDVLLADPPDGAIVVDWKDSWGVPPEAPTGDAGSDDPDHISYHGYFQQRFYGYLVMRNFPAIRQVTLREFYPRKSVVRKATLQRDALDVVQRELSILVATLDDALMLGTGSAAWVPSAGKHCGYCPRPAACPIPDDARGEGAIRSAAQARRYADEYWVAKEVYGQRRDALKEWVNLHGPVALKSAKGRLELGFKPNSTGRGEQFRAYVPTTSDRGPDPDDLRLAAALKESAQA